MALSTYAQLKSAIGTFSNRADLSAYFDDTVLLAEKWIFRNVRARSMETAFDKTISAAVTGAVGLPSDYVEAKYLYIDGSPTKRLKRKDAGWIYENYPTRSSDSKPAFFGREHSVLIFGPYPDSNYVVKGVYYKRLESMTTAGGSTTNGIFADHPDLYLFASLSELEAFVKNDERIAVWKAKRDETAANINGEEKASDSSGGGLEMAAG